MKEISSAFANAHRQLADAQGNRETAELQGRLSTEIETQTSLELLQTSREKQSNIDSIDFSALDRAAQSAGEQVNDLKKEKKWETRKNNLFLKAEKEGTHSFCFEKEQCAFCSD